MKILLSLLILVSASAMFGQNTPEDSGKNAQTEKEQKKQQKEQEKQQKELEKRQQKADKERRKALENQNVVDLDSVAMFPQNFTNRTVRFKSVGLGELQRYTEGSQSAYFIEVSTRQNIFYAFPTTDKMSFLMNEDMAKEVFTFYSENKDTFGTHFAGHLTGQISSIQANNGITFFVMKLDCIDFIGFFSKKLKSVGSCGQ